MTLNARTILEVSERLIVIAAAVIAVFPLYQWYTEAEDRRLQRITGFISAGAECYDIMDYDELKVLIEYESLDVHIRNTIWSRLQVAGLCSELFSSLWLEFGGKETDKFLDDIVKWGTSNEFLNYSKTRDPQNLIQIDRR